MTAELLWEGADPCAGIAPAVNHLLTRWVSRFQLSIAALFWFDEEADRCGCCVARPSDQGEVLFLTSTGLGCLAPEDLLHNMPGILPHEQQLHWLHFSTGGTVQVRLGVPVDQAEAEFPNDWKTATSVLLTTAVRFDRELTRQKLEALAEFAAGAGHEINNPLGSMIGRTSLLLKSESDPEKRRMLETIGAQAYRVGDMIGDTMLFARPPEMKPTLLDWQTLVESVLPRFHQQMEDLQISIALESNEQVPLFADLTQMQIVIAELLRNAIKAIQELAIEADAVRIVTIRYSSQERRRTPGGLLEIGDSGKGLNQEQQEHCFDPFYSGDQAGRGLGFGLSKCWRIVQRHRGEITLDRHENQTWVRVWIPAEA